jgi:hypothetical protein
MAATAILASGSQGVVGLVQHGWPRQQVVEQFVAMCVGACCALEGNEP